MPRHKYKKNKAQADSIYKSVEVMKLINYVMLDGKKTVAEEIVYTVMEDLKKIDADPLKVFYLAIENASPIHEVKPRRLGGASYLVPTEVRKDRKLYLALNWMIEAAKARSNKEYKTFAQKLLAEIVDASKNQGQTIAKKAQTEKVADANKAFSHLKW